MTQIYEYLTYEDIDPCFKSKGLYRSLAQLYAHGLTLIIQNELSILKPEEVVNFCSFLNMICQTHPSERVQKRVIKDLKEYNISDSIEQFLSNNKVLCHRDMLLYLISEVFMGQHAGTKLCTGRGNEAGSKKLYELFLLTNSRLGKELDQSSLYLQLLRRNPRTYDLVTTRNYYLRWIVRYWHIYTELLKKLKKPKDTIEKGLELLEQDINVTIQEYFKVVAAFYNWFLEMPYRKEKNEIQDGGFDPDRIDTFYLQKENFSTIWPTLDKLSKSLSSMKEFMQQQEQYKSFDPVFKNLMKLFHYPVFKTDENVCCIIDLKFLIEGVCGGLFWRLDHFLKNNNLRKDFNLEGFRGEYGNLIELYFVELLNKVFGQSNKSIKGKEGEPDAIICTDSHILIFECTVGYYRQADLHSSNIKGVHTRLDELLFDKAKKFVKLNNYCTKYKRQDKKIIPILVTESYLGDESLIEKSGYNIKQKIDDNKLEHLQVNIPLIISLDELEIFWSYAPNDKKEAIKKFIEIIEDWHSEKDKAQYVFSFGRFLIDKLSTSQPNKEYEMFFNPTHIQ